MPVPSAQHRSRLAALLPLAAVALAGCPGRPQGPSDEAIGHLNAGIAYLEQHRFAQAGQEFEEALKLHPAYLEGHIDLAIARAAEIKYAEAEREIDQALAVDPENPTANYMRGLIAKYQGEKERAVASFEKVLRSDPDDVDTLYNLATLYKDQGDFQRATAMLERVIASAPHFASAYYALGQAYLRQGQEKKDDALIAKGQETILKFQRISGGVAAETAGLRYGEQGRYALAVEDASPRPAAAGPAVRFEEAAGASGIAFRNAGKAGELGGGVLLHDLDLDGATDVLLLGSDDGRAGRLFRNDGKGHFAEIEGGDLARVKGPAAGVAAGDYDNDGKPDLFLAGRLLHGEGGGAFRDATDGAGLGASSLAGHAGASFADLDHDGDLDLALTFPQAPGLRVFSNDGKGVFTDTTASSGLELAEGAAAMVFTDFDNDRDVDLLVGVVGGPPRLYANQRGFRFEDASRRLGLEAGGTGSAAGATPGVSAADLDGDGWLELLVVNGRPGGHALLRSRKGSGFAAETLPARSAGAGAVFLDADLDGDLDLVVAEREGLRFWKNDGLGGLTDATAAVGLDAIKSDVRGLAAADLDGDGDLDLVGNVYGGSALILLNRGAESSSWVRVLPRGLNSNKSGFGTKVEVRTGRVHQKLELRGADGFLSQGPQALTFGLDGRDRVDRVRLLWPGGVLQAELEVKARQTNPIVELDRKGSSCPFLFAYDGREMAFVSDILGGSPLGLWLAPGVSNRPDPDEWLLLPEGSVTPRDGAYDLRISEALEEVCYLDRAMLRVVDVPAPVRVFANERLLFLPPFAGYGLHLVAETRPLVAARDGEGRDVREALLAIDRRFAGAPSRDRFRGFARPWSLVLDFGRLTPEERSRPVVLLAHGTIEFANSTPFFAAAQQDVHPSLPALDIRDGRGRVVRTLTDAGAPAGLPKWMVLDLTGQIPADGRVELVYRTNLEVYFDQVELGLGSRGIVPEVHDVEAATAVLDFAGYPQRFSPDGGWPMLYRYQPLLGDETWASQEGLYTRHGDVRELVAASDDRLVVMSHGDEVRLTFPTRSLPPLRPGMARHLLFHSVGYAKDLDLHSAAPFTVGPLPYRAMASYPYDSPGLLTDPGYRDSLARFNTRYVRDRSQSLR